MVSKSQKEKDKRAEINPALALGLVHYHDVKYKALDIQAPPYSFYIMALYARNFEKQIAILAYLKAAELHIKVQTISAVISELTQAAEYSQDVEEQRSILITCLKYKRELDMTLADLAEIERRI